MSRRFTVRSLVGTGLLANSASCCHELARSRMGSAKARAFTLLELLTVIALIGILAALLFPGIHAARIAADRARTRVQFNQWAAALEGFRSEYGYYPVLH